MRAWPAPAQGLVATGIAPSAITQVAKLGIGVAVAADEVASFQLAATIASAASAVWNGLNVLAATATLSGSTNITTANGFNLITIAAPVLSSALALTVTNAATVVITGAPTGAGAGPASITNAYSLWVQAGNVRFDGSTLYPSTTAFSTAIQFGGAQKFTYDAANNTGIMNGTTAQIFSVYNTFTAGTPDHERFEINWAASANTCVLRTGTSGTGTARNLVLAFPGGATGLVIPASSSSAIQIYSGTVSGSSSIVNIAMGSSITSTAGTKDVCKWSGALSDGGTTSTTVINAINVSPSINYTAASKTGKVVLAYFGPTNTSLPTGQSAAIGLSSTSSALGGIVWNNQADEDTNYEKVYQKFNSNVWEIGSVKGGSGTLRGLRFGITGNSIGFYGSTPVALQTGVAVTAAGIHAALVNLNLFTA